MKRTLHFWIIPIVLLVTGLFYVSSYGMFFLRNVDPEFAYLFNGMVMARLKLDVAFITNPGTPVECLVAIVARVVHLFRPGQALIDDVLLNPDLYIRSVLCVSIFLNALAIYFLGVCVYKFSDNLILAFFLQLTPFANLLTVETLSRMMPEGIMNIIVCCWLIVLVKILFQQDQEINYKKYSLILALLFSLGMADKLTFLPFIVLPLMILPGWKVRLNFLGFSVAFFMLFAFPVTLRFRVFYQWATNIFTHTGSYGGGDAGIIRWSEFKDHFVILAHNNALLLGSAITLFCLTILSLLKSRKENLFHAYRIKLSLALTAVVMLEFVFAAKHFAYHYMVPSLLLTVFVLFVITVQLNYLFPIMKKKFLNVIMVFTGMLIVISIIPKVKEQLQQVKEATERKELAYQKISPYLKGTPKIISPDYFGCSAIEYALTYGLHESGRHGKAIFERMKMLYPSTYLYFSWGKEFYEGRKKLLPEDFLQSDKTYTLYIAQYSDDKMKEFQNILKTDTSRYEYAIQEVFDWPATAERVFTMKRTENQLKAKGK